MCFNRCRKFQALVCTWCHASAVVRGSEVSACGEGVGVSGCEDGLQMVEIYGWTVALWCGWVCATQSAAAPTLLRVSLSCSRFMLDGLCRGWGSCEWMSPSTSQRCWEIIEKLLAMIHINPIRNKSAVASLQFGWEFYWMDLESFFPFY